MKRSFWAALLTAFMVMAPMTTLAAGNNFVISDGVLVQYDGPGGDVVIPDGVTEIDGSVFADREDLTGVVIPNGVTDIGPWAFKGCTSLQRVVIPESVTEFGSEAFYGTPWLKRLGEFAAVNGVLLRYQGPGGQVILPKGITKIAPRAFIMCTTITGVVLPDGVASIGSQAFIFCDELTSVTIPSSATSIADSIIDDFSDVTVYGTTGSEAERYCAEREIPFIPLPADPGAAQTGTMEGNGRNISWRITAMGELTMAGTLAQGEAILVGCYDSNGRFTGAKWLDAETTAAQIDPNTPNVKLFWLDSQQSPLSPSATVWGE